MAYHDKISSDKRTRISILGFVFLRKAWVNVSEVNQEIYKWWDYSSFSFSNFFFPRKCKLSSKGTLHKLDEFPWWATHFHFSENCRFFKVIKCSLWRAWKGRQLVLSSVPGALWANVGFQLAPGAPVGAGLPRVGGCTSHGGSSAAAASTAPGLECWLGSWSCAPPARGLPRGHNEPWAALAGHLWDLRCTSPYIDPGLGSLPPDPAFLPG